MSGERLGIGIITYNRCDIVLGCIERIRAKTRGNYDIVVADDGSEDRTVRDCRNAGLTIVTGANRGVCWNRNRALLTLMKHTKCDPIILIEDDCWPVEDGWNTQWVIAAGLHNHICVCHPIWESSWCAGGLGTPEEPWLSRKLTGQLIAVSRLALLRVGYLDTRFCGYGFGHIEWTERFAKVGYVRRHRYPCLDGGLEFRTTKSYRNPKEVSANNRLIEKIRRKPFSYVGPCYDPKDLPIMENEIQRAFDYSVSACKLVNSHV